MTAQAQRPAYDPATIAATMAALGAGGPATGASNNAAAPQKEKATIYLGVGYLRDGADITSDNFDPANDIINLPQLTGLDNMNPDTRRAGTQEFADRQADSNGLLDDMSTEALAKMQPGETRIIGYDANTGLVVTLYRKKDEVVAQPKAERIKRSFLG